MIMRLALRRTALIGQLQIKIMKTELYTNCSLVRIPIKAGVTEYHFPMNVDWANRKIDKIVFPTLYCSTPGQTCLDPVDGTTPTMLIGTVVPELYVDLYSTDNREIMHHVKVPTSLTQATNPILRIDTKLDLQLCRLFFTEAPTNDETLLAYVFYGTRDEEYYDLPKKSVTAVFELQANEQKSFQSIINDYVRALPGKVQGVIAWSCYDAPAYITLRDRDLTYQMQHIPTQLCAPARLEYNYFIDTYIPSFPKQMFLLNDLDIDFDNSYIREACGVNGTQKITFYYS